jgi:hypothetical protein
MLREAFKTVFVANRLPEGEFRFFFFSREAPRPHVHVSHSDGEAKFWISPTVELARNIGLGFARIKHAERLVETRQQEVIDAWCPLRSESTFQPRRAPDSPPSTLRAHGHLEPAALLVRMMASVRRTEL